jgi:mono/diheme cytochrome c family protein
MTRVHAIATACLTLSAVAAFGFQNSARPASSATTNPAAELVNQYCVSCHNQRLKTANLMLDRADSQHAANSAEAWEKVIVKLRSRAMPPPGMPRPDNATYDAVADWLASEVDRTAPVNPGRTASLHRLNRSEYANAVRDLVAVEVDAQAMLPPDEQAFGFENNAEALSMPPALLDRYVSAASAIARRAIGDPTMPPAFVRYGAMKNNPNDLTYLRQTERLGEDFPLGTKGGVAARHYFPVDGEYVFRLRLQRAWDNIIRGVNVPNQIEIRVDGVRVAQFTIGGEKSPSKTFQYDGDEGLQARVPVKAGLRQVMATMLKADDAAPEGGGPDRLSSYSRSSDNASSPIAIAALLIGGPYDGKIALSPSRRLLLVCRPANAAEEAPCAAKILSSLARRAYRRSATGDDVQTLLSFYNRARATGSFDDGIRSALERVLVSPDFLFRIEADPPSDRAQRQEQTVRSSGAAPGSVYRISDVELASRLSFFLWGSIPDDTLLDLAVRGKLHEPAVLEQQVSRMFADPGARTSLLQNFFEDWLQTRNVWLLNPDSTKFPWFDDNLRTAFVTETELFLDAQLKEDHSILDLLTSDETFLNEQLARHYGISGVYGSHFRRVKLTDENRFGLLGKASVLAVTSYTTRTSPTIRGKWLLENILAAPMPPPPPNIPALESSNKDGKPLSVREMLEMHRANATCASCHTRMDPLGLSLENFDAIGRWRTTDAGRAIDASGVLLDGTKVNGPRELRQALVAKKTQFTTAVTEKLLTYALGRGLEFYDAPAVRAIDREAAANGYRWSSLIQAIVKSDPFQMRTAASRGSE